MQYDGDWTVAWDTISTLPTNPSSWPAITNGNVAVVPFIDASNRYGTISSKNVIGGHSTQSFFDSLEPLDTFDFAKVKCVLVNTADDHSVIQQISVVDVRLDLHYGVLSVTFDTSVSGLMITHEWRALKNVQFAIMHTIKFIGSVPSDTFKIMCFHEVSPVSGWPSADVVHNSDAVNGIGYDDGSDKVLLVHSSLYRDVSRNVFQSCAQAYIRVGNDTTIPHPISSYTTERNAATVVIPLVIEDPLMSIDVTLSILTAVTSGPLDASTGAGKLARKLVVAQFGNTQERTPNSALAAVVAANEAAWDKIWKSFVKINGTASDIVNVNWALRYSQWMLHSCNCSTAAEASMGVGDVALDGPVANGRMNAGFVNNALLTNFPAAELQLVTRAGQLDHARRATRGDGHQGAAFPYNEHKGADVSEATIALINNEPHTVRGSAMLAIDAWNHYRLRLDKRWLNDYGYAMIRDACDYVASLATQPDEVGQPRLYVLPSEQAGILDLVAAIGALRAGIEASYALGYDPRDEWVAIRYGLMLPVDGLDPSILLAPADTNLNPVDTLEPLRALQEPFFSLASDFGLVKTNMIVSTYEQWAPALGTACKTYVAEMARLTSLAQIMQIVQTASSKTNYQAQLATLLTTHFDNATGFGNAREPLALQDADTASAAHNNEIGALFVLSVIHGIAGVRITGGLTETGEAYASFGVNSSAFAALPEDWDSITVKGMGYAQADVIIMNGTSDFVATASDEPWQGTFIP